jgi:hypothetical protein
MVLALMPLIGLSRHHIYILQIVIFPLQMRSPGRMPFPMASTEILSDECSQAIGEVALVYLLRGV